jgi:hypothetical protein
MKSLTVGAGQPALLAAAEPAVVAAEIATAELIMVVAPPITCHRKIPVL